MLGEVARLTVAVIFALAAIHAMRAWALFGGIIEQYRIVPGWLAPIFARVVPLLELAAAAALVVPMTSQAGAILGLCLMAAFTVAIAVNLARGRVAIDCGCGGADGQQLSAGLILRNLVVMGGLAAALNAPLTGQPDGSTSIGVIFASLALITLYFAANQLMTNFQALNALNSRSSS
jgi:hypothetical protein